MVFENLLDPVLSPLLRLDPFVAILLIAFVITLCITLVYKFATDQKRMAELKAKSKEYQKKMKAARDDPDKMMKLQKEAMGFNMELMKHSFRPTLYTLIPIIIIFGWLNAHMAFMNLAPGEVFTVEATFDEDAAALLDGFEGVNVSFIPEGIDVVKTETLEDGVRWSLTGPAGEYKATVSAGNGVEADKAFLITPERRYVKPVETYDGAITTITVGNKPIRPLPFSLLGWNPGWLGTYIILSVILSILIRKTLKVV